LRKDLKYILILVGAGTLYVFMEIITPKTINWTVTLASLDKNPFGAYLLNERLDDLFDNTSKSNLTLYELQDSVKNTFILAQNFSPGEEDTEAILNTIDNGGKALIVASHFYGKLADTLGVATEDYLFQGNVFQNLNKEDTAALAFSSASFDNKYFYQRNNTQYYFNHFDSTKASVLAYNDLDRPTLLKMPWGKGELLLCSTPLAFTNNYMVYQNNFEFVSNVMSYMPEKHIHWTEYYQLGRMEARTPLRFILSDEGLKWAYYIAIITLLLFIIFEAKRKQRVIPVIEPLRNDTLDFVGTISNLYYQNKAHKSIAEKKINFFIDKLNQHYFINLSESHAEFISKVAHKTGNDEEDVESLFNTINQLRKQPKISEQELLELSKKIEAFKLN